MYKIHASGKQSSNLYSNNLEELKKKVEKEVEKEDWVQHTIKGTNRYFIWEQHKNKFRYYEYYTCPWGDTKFCKETIIKVC